MNGFHPSIPVYSSIHCHGEGAGAARLQWDSGDAQPYQMPPLFRKTLRTCILDIGRAEKELPKALSGEDLEATEWVSTPQAS